MPRLSKRAKQEWSFFIGENGRRQYNLQCRQCQRECKQSFRAEIVCCPVYHSKRKAGAEKALV
jgi:hypothetical protein